MYETGHLFELLFQLIMLLFADLMDAIIFGSFFVLVLAALVLNKLSSSTDSQKKSVSNVNFLSFQRSFFIVYFLALFGDWLQGPYVYKLYEFYGFKESQIALLYVAGFASSVIFGTATGPLADSIGRKKMAIAFCITYTLCCVTKVSSNFWILMLGRVMGGIATSMLFSTFESWYVYEHSERHGFPGEWIGVTFSAATFFNGLLAIVAGVVANFAAESLSFGPVSPFIIAIAPLTISGIIISRTWQENYGSSKSSSSLPKSCMDGLRCIFEDRKILLLGCIQSAVESTMYIFVFLWTPILMPANPPLGMVFACFMVAIMIGSSLYNILLSRAGFQDQDNLKLVLIFLGITMGICNFTVQPVSDDGRIDENLTGLVITFFAFILLELAIGIYFPSISYLKSQVIPESRRANVMNWFRVPMNVITCGALLCLRVDWISHDKRIIFRACLILIAFGYAMCYKLSSILKDEVKERKSEAGQGLLQNEDV